MDARQLLLAEGGEVLQEAGEGAAETQNAVFEERSAFFGVAQIEDFIEAAAAGAELPAVVVVVVAVVVFEV